MSRVTKLRFKVMTGIYSLLQLLEGMKVLGLATCCRLRCRCGSKNWCLGSLRMDCYVTHTSTCSHSFVCELQSVSSVFPVIFQTEKL